MLGNFASHAARRDEPVRPDWVDPFSSAAAKGPRTAQVALFPAPAAQAPKTWLLRQGAAAAAAPMRP